MTLTATTVGSRSTVPALLVHLGTTPATYLSTRGDITALSQTWVAAGVSVAGLSTEGSGNRRVRIAIPDPDLDWVSTVKALPADLAVNVYAAYRSTAGTWETLQEFSGVAVAASHAVDGVATFQLEAAADGPDTEYTPRVSLYSPYNVPRGTLITINNERFLLE